MKTYHFCVIARRARFFAPDAAIFKPKVWHPGTKFGETARSGMRPTCTPSPCTSCLVFPYKTADRSKQIRLLLPFCLRRAYPPNLLARRRFNDPAYCIALFHTVPLRVLPIAYWLGRKNAHPGRAERRLRLARQPTKSFAGSLAPPFSAFLQRARWLVLQTRKKCAIISVSKC